MLLVIDGYWANADGTVIGKRGKPLRTFPKSNGYLYFTACGADGMQQVAVHRYVWVCHKGPIPDGLVVDHINGIRGDPRLQNLRLLTNRQNVMSGKTGKLSEGDVMEIKSLLGSVTNRSLAKQFNVSEQLICDIKYGRKHK